jgi:hypothetical protein
MTIIKVVAEFTCFQFQLKIKVLGKNWGTEHSKGNKTVPANVATTRTEDGHK